MKGLSVMDCVIASLLPTLPTGLILPPVAPGPKNLTDHRIQRELFQTVLTLNISKPPTLGIKLSCTGNRQEVSEKCNHPVPDLLYFLLKFAVVVLTQIYTDGDP